MATPAEIAIRFNDVDAHDDTVESFRFIPASGRVAPKVEVILLRHWLGTRRLVTFAGCANVEILLDADVLSKNSPSNTARFEASADAAEIERIMRRHRKFWNVRYERSIDPMPAKIARLDRLVCFRVRLFGGQLQMLARSFAVTRIARLKSHDNAIE